MKEWGMPTENAYSGRKPRYGLWIVLLLLIAGGAGGYWFIQVHSAARDDHPTGKVAKYHCPMHPTVVSDKPGDCPICGMKLVPDTDSAPAKKEHKVVYYRNPMDPQVTSPVPTKDPMGMDYVPVYEDEVSSAASVPGQGTVNASPALQQLVGVNLTSWHNEKSVRHHC